MKRLQFLAVLGLLLSAQTGFANSLTASYNHTTQNVDFERHNSERVGATFSFNLFLYLRFDISYAQETRNSKGHKESLDSQGYASYRYFETRTVIDTAGGNLSLVIYPGQTFMPYIFGGVSRSVYDYSMVIEEADGEKTEYKSKSDPVISPVAGFGLAIAMNRNFSLKASHTWRQGVTQAPGEDAKRVYDGTADFGITYEFQ